MPTAKHWVEEHFPAARGPAKAALILTYGAGVDAGLAEAEDILTDMQKTMRRAMLAKIGMPVNEAAQ